MEFIEAVERRMKGERIELNGWELTENCGSVEEISGEFGRGLNHTDFLSNEWKVVDDWNLAKTKLCGTICDSCGDTYVGFSYDKFTTENVKKCKDLILEELKQLKNFNVSNGLLHEVFNTINKRFGDL